MIKNSGADFDSKVSTRNIINPYKVFENLNTSIKDKMQHDENQNHIGNYLRNTYTDNSIA